MVPALLTQPAILCLVTDRNMVGRDRLADAVRKAVDGGVGMLQLREKDLPTDVLAAMALELRLACEGRALLMINGDIDAAIISDADGVHLPEAGPAVADVRKRLGGGKVIGRSVHSLESAVRSYEEGADYLIAGTIFETRSHPGNTRS